ncbi:MAG: hypothetical protein RR291_02580, partial [Clostridia bacterium]
VDDGVKLYTNATQNKITFELIKSYYLKVIEESNGYYFVELGGGGDSFPTLCGYVLTEEVKPIQETPISPTYPSVKIRVTADSSKIFLSPTANANILCIATNTQSVSFYGKISDKDDTLWYYVYFAGKFGYSPSFNFTAPSISLHPTPLPTVPVPDTPIDTEPTTPKDDSEINITQIVLICFVCLLAIGFAIAIFSGKTDKEKTSPMYFDKFL